MNRHDQEDRRRHAWQTGLARVDELIKDFPDTTYLAEAVYERGWAPAETQSRLEEAASAELPEGAGQKHRRAGRARRAQFAIGEIGFQQEEIRRRGDELLPGPLQLSLSAVAGGRRIWSGKCFEALHKRSQAIKLYQELVDKFPQSDKVAAAKSRIEALQKE